MAIKWGRLSAGNTGGADSLKGHRVDRCFKGQEVLKDGSGVSARDFGDVPRKVFNN